LKLGGLIYVLGLVWHLFVAAAAGFHYYAILNHVFPETDSTNILGPSNSMPQLSNILKSHIEL